MNLQELQCVGRVSLVFNQEPLNDFPLDYRPIDDLRNVMHGDAAIPNGFGVDHQSHSVLACVEATRIVRADGFRETPLLKLCLEKIPYLA